MLLVSLLDGQVVALRFGIPDEFGQLLDSTEQARIFQLRYSIDLNEITGGSCDEINGVGGGGGGGSSRPCRQLIVGDSARPKLIENPLHFIFENRHENNESDDEDEDDKNINNNIMNNNNDDSATTSNNNRQKELLLSSE